MRLQNGLSKRYNLLCCYKKMNEGKSLIIVKFKIHQSHRDGLMYPTTASYVDCKHTAATVANVFLSLYICSISTELRFKAIYCVAFSDLSQIRAVTLASLKSRLQIHGQQNKLILICAHKMCQKQFLKFRPIGRKALKAERWVGVIF